MINLRKKDSVADSIRSILQHEEIDVNDRSKETIAGRIKTKQKDDVGPAADGKPTKVRFHAGPKNEEVELSEMEKKLADTMPESGVVKTVYPVPRDSEDLRAKEGRKKQGMKESITLKTFKEKYEEHSMIEQMINEVLSKDATAGDWIHDFIHSDNPKFKGKSKAERKKMALGAYYAKQRNEEVEQIDEKLKGNQHKIDKNKNNKIDAQDFKILRGEKKANEEVEVIDEMDKSQKGAPGWNISDDDDGKEHYGKIAKVKSVLKTAGKALHKGFTGGSDEDQRKDLQRKMGLPQTGKKPTSEEVEQIDELSIETMKSAKAGLASKAVNAHYDDNKRAAMDYANRALAIGRKIKKKEKQTTKEEVEQIDELSINTLSRVKHAATSAASDASREGDEGKATKRYDLAGKASNKIETKNRAAGLKPSGQHTFEEVEQIDELSKGTLSSYLDKKKAEYMKGKTVSGSKENAKDIQNMGKAHDKLNKEEVDQVEEGWDDMVKDAKEKVASGPKPSGGSGKKEGSRYGGSKQKEKPEQEEMKESKRPENDSVPFEPPYNTTSSPANMKDKSGATHTPMSRAKHLARLSMKKLRKEMLGKTGTSE